MGEDYWDRRRRHLNEDHKFRREQSKRDISILKSKENIDRLTDEITRRKRSEELKALLDGMDQQKASVLTRIWRCSSIRKNKWCECLSNIDLTHPGADAELKNLHEEVERERQLWTDFKLPDPPEWWKSLTGVVSGLSTKFEPPEKRRTSPSLNPFELRLEQQEQDRQLARKLKESEFALIVSSLGLLISTRDLYESTLTR